MVHDLPDDLTRFINDLDSRDRHAVAELLPVVYADLRRMASSLFKRQSPDHTLQPTALVHEAYVRLVSAGDRQYANREHFFRAAALAMRHILVSHARERGRLKRGGEMTRVEWSEPLAAFDEKGIDLLALDMALLKLSQKDRRMSQVVELRFFAGLDVAEVAEVLGVSLRTVEQDWTLAKAWLGREMKG